MITKILKIFFSFFALAVFLVVLFFGYKDIPLDELKAKYAKPPSSFIPVLGMDVHFRDEGIVQDSLPVVLIHGTGASLHTFDGWRSELIKNRRVIRMDLPGYGLTGPFPHREYTIDNYVEFVKHFLDSKDIGQCIIGGNSLGGHISWRFAKTYPDRVDKIILIDAAGYPFEAKSEPLAFRVAKIPMLKNIFTFITPRFVARSSVENVYADKSKVTEELASRYFELTLREGNRQAFIDRFAAQNDDNAYMNIPSIQQPTLVLWGKKDLLIPVENAQKFHRDLPNSTLVLFEDLGHVPMEEDPILSIRPVLDFIKQ